MVEELQEAVLRSQVDAQDAAGRLIDHVLGAIGGDVGAHPHSESTPVMIAGAADVVVVRAVVLAGVISAPAS